MNKIKLLLTVLASSYPELQNLLTLRAAFMNPACHWDLADMPEAERLAQVAELDAMLAEALRELAR